MLSWNMHFTLYIWDVLQKAYWWKLCYLWCYCMSEHLQWWFLAICLSSLFHNLYRNSNQTGHLKYSLNHLFVIFVRKFTFQVVSTLAVQMHHFGHNVYTKRSQTTIWTMEIHKCFEKKTQWTTFASPQKKSWPVLPQINSVLRITQNMEVRHGNSSSNNWDILVYNDTFVLQVGHP